MCCPRRTTMATYSLKGSPRRSPSTSWPCWVSTPSRSSRAIRGSRTGPATYRHESASSSTAIWSAMTSDTTSGWVSPEDTEPAARSTPTLSIPQRLPDAGAPAPAPRAVARPAVERDQTRVPGPDDSGGYRHWQPVRATYPLGPTKVRGSSTCLTAASARRRGRNRQCVGITLYEKLHHNRRSQPAESANTVERAAARSQPGARSLRWRAPLPSAARTPPG